MAVLTVTTTDDVVDPGDGQLSLREALNQANATAAADTIRFAAAVEGRMLTLTGGQLTVSRDVTIDGDADGSGDRVTIDAGGDSRVLMIGGTGTDAGLQDLVITGGDSQGGNGGGIFVGAGNTLALDRSWVVDNATKGSGEIEAFYAAGGGIFAAAGAHVAVQQSIIGGNDAYQGGGIYVGEGARLHLDRSLLADNSGSGYRYGFGGSLYLKGASAVVEQSTIADSRASKGGGIHASDSSLTLLDSTISGNSVSQRFGGGQGGGLFLRGGETVLVGVTVTGNQADDPRPYYGGGVPGGGGIYVSRDSTAALRLANTIVAGNLVAGYFTGIDTPDDIRGTITGSNGHNIFGTDVLGNAVGDLENIAPARLFAAVDLDTGGGQLALNGGPTPTAALRDSAGNPALGRASPADAADTDQRGVDRPQPAGSNPDIGAFELDRGAGSSRPSGGPDVIAGTDGDDTIEALGGNDFVDGLDGIDTLYGGAGIDALRGGTGRDRLDGGDGNDRLAGGAGQDRLHGGQGMDRLGGGPGSDTLDGGPGIDRAVYHLDPERSSGLVIDLATGQGDSVLRATYRI